MRNFTEISLFINLSPKKYGIIIWGCVKKIKFKPKPGFF